MVKRTDAIWKIGEDAYARISALISTGGAPVGVDHVASQALIDIDAIAQGDQILSVKIIRKGKEAKKFDAAATFKTLNVEAKQETK